MSITSTIMGALSPKQAAKLEENARVIDELRATEKSAAEIGEKIAAEISRFDELDRASLQLVADGATDIDEPCAAEKSAAEIGEKVTAEGSRIDELDRASLQLVADGATDIEIDAALVALDEVRHVLQRLQLQERAAAQYLAEAKRAAHLLAIANMRKGIARKLDKRHTLSVDYETKFAELEKVRRALFEANTELKVAWPGGIIPSGCFVEPGELVAAIEAHAYRYVDPFVVSTSTPGMPAPPGARCPRHDWLGQPDKVPNLAAEIERANVHLLAQLDRVPEAPSAPAALAEPPDPLDAAFAQRREDGVPKLTLKSSRRME